MPYGPIWETDLFLPSVPSPSAHRPPKPPILVLTHLSLRAPTNTPRGLDDLAVFPGVNVPPQTDVLWRGVVQLEGKAAWRWVRPEARARVGGERKEGSRVRVVVQGRWRMCTFDDNYATELRRPGTDALVMHTRTNRRYEVRSMDAGCYVRSRLWLERALLVNFVVMCGTALRETEQSIPWLVDKYKKMYKKDNPSTAFFTTDIYHTLAVHASWLKDYWVRAKWRNAEYEKRVGVPVPEWDRFSRKVEEKKAKAAREGRSWGRKREVGAGEGKSPGKRKRAAPPASQTRGEGSAKKRRVDVRKTPAEASTSPETARMEPADLFRRPHVAGPSPARTPGMSAAESASARRTGSRARRTVEEIDLSGSVATTRRVSTRRKSSASRRRAPSAPSEEADLDLTMADSDDPDPGEEDELFGSSPAPPVRGPRAPPPMEMDEQSASGSEAEVEGLFTPPPERGRRGRSLEAEQKKARGGWGDDEDPWTTPVHAVQPWVPRETYKPRALPEKGAEMPACFTHRPVLSPSYAWRCPLPSCTYTIDFLRPSAAFRDSLKKEEVLIARAKHASHTGSRLNGLFYECVMKHYRVHLGEMKVQWPVKLGK